METVLEKLTPIQKAKLARREWSEAYDNDKDRLVAVPISREESLRIMSEAPPTPPIRGIGDIFILLFIVPPSRNVACFTQYLIHKLRFSPKWIRSICRKLEHLHMRGCHLRGWCEYFVPGVISVGPRLGLHSKSNR